MHIIFSICSLLDTLKKTNAPWNSKKALNFRITKGGILIEEEEKLKKIKERKT